MIALTLRSIQAIVFLHSSCWTGHYTRADATYHPVPPHSQESYTSERQVLLCTNVFVSRHVHMFTSSFALPVRTFQGSLFLVAEDLTRVKKNTNKISTTRARQAMNAWRGQQSPKHRKSSLCRQPKVPAFHPSCSPGNCLQLKPLMPSVPPSPLGFEVVDFADIADTVQ